MVGSFGKISKPLLTKSLSGLAAIAEADKPSHFSEKSLSPVSNFFTSNFLSDGYFNIELVSIIIIFYLLSIFII